MSALDDDTNLDEIGLGEESEEGEVSQATSMLPPNDGEVMYPDFDEEEIAAEEALLAEGGDIFAASRANDAKIQAEDDFRNKTTNDARDEHKQRQANGMSREESNKLRVEKLNLANRNVGYEYWVNPKRPALTAVRRKPNWNPARDQVVRDHKWD